MVSILKIISIIISHYWYFFSPLFLTGFDYFEASAKENINVRQVFERLVDIICEKMSESIESDPSRGTSGRSMRLTDNPPPSQQNCSC